MKTVMKITTLICCTAVAIGLTTSSAAEKKDDLHPSGKLMKGSNVVDAKLFDQHGKQIGQIDDVLFDENSGGMTHAIVAVGGWLGIGDKDSAVPWKFIHPSKDNTAAFVLTVDQSRLKDSDHFDKNNWPVTDQNWYGKNYQHYGLTPRQNAKLVRASQVIGAELFNQHGEKIGDIKNILMHPKTGMVAYATLDIGKYVGKGDQLTNVPWQLVRQSTKDTAGFVVNADKAKLAGATYFEPSAWPAYDDWGWQANTYGYYGYEPYWTHPIMY